MKEVLDLLINNEEDCCVSVVLNTHRTKPDVQKDHILLKNLLAEAEHKLFEEYDKRKAQEIVSRLRILADSIDHSQNQNSLLLFVNQSIAELVRLPVEVEDRVVLADTFATRDLVRALHLQKSYYILVISRDKARLIEAFNNQLIREIDDIFPIENTELYLTTDHELSKSKQKDLMKEEFFNRVDKVMQDVVKANTSVKYNINI